MIDQIKHVWFDMDGTLTIQTPEFHKVHDELRYRAYSDAVGRPVTKELADEFEALYKQHGSNSAIFVSMGMPQGYWQQYFSTLDQSKFYKPVPDVYQTLDKLREKVPISLFTNSSLEIINKTLKAVGVDIHWFTYILSGDDIKKPKPDLEGFRLMLAKTGLPPHQCLYVGDRVDVDIKPAKQVRMQTCLVYTSSDQADYSFSKMPELLSLF
jgi:HAD superfamily hydrolase (TIGR01662 family)